MTGNAQALKDVQRLVKQIMPILRGKGPDVQGAVLADLASLWVAGHAPVIRDDVMKMHFQAIRDLVPESEKQLFGKAGHPDRQWREAKK